MYKEHFLLLISKLLKLLDPEFVLTCGSGFLYTTQGSYLLEKISVSGVVLWTQHRCVPCRWGCKPPCMDWAWCWENGTDWWTQQLPSRALVSLQQTWLGVGKLDKPRDLLWDMVGCCNSCCCHLKGSYPHWSQPHNLLATSLSLSSPLSFRPDASLLMNLEQVVNRCSCLHQIWESRVRGLPCISWSWLMVGVYCCWQLWGPVSRNPLSLGSASVLLGFNEPTCELNWGCTIT